MSKIAALAHERDSQVAFVSETGVPAHKRDPRAPFSLLIVRMVLKIGTGLGAKMHAPCPVSKEHYFLK